MKKQISIKIYGGTLIVTICIFVLALFISNYINKRKTEELKSVEDKITVDILSLESELDVLKSGSCASLTTSTLRIELQDLNNRLTFMEQQVGTDNPEVFRLKRYYSLLEIRDYLLTKQASDECKRNDIFILYFYAAKDCSQCTTQEYILRALQDEYPEVIVYSFDYNLDLPAVKTLITLHNVPNTPPVIEINGKEYAPFDTLQSMDAVLQPLLTATTSVTTTASLKAKK